MLNTSSTSARSPQKIVIDANVAAWAVLPNIAVIQTLQQMKSWYRQERQIIAPDLWIAEAASVIRRCVFSKMISSDEGTQAIDDLFTLGIDTIPITRQLCHVALSWASKLQHARAYDSLYLALAEQEDAWLWTADKRLVNGARQRGFSQIAWIGEREAKEPIEEAEEKAADE